MTSSRIPPSRGCGLTPSRLAGHLFRQHAGEVGALTASAVPSAAMRAQERAAAEWALFEHATEAEANQRRSVRSMRRLIDGKRVRLVRVPTHEAGEHDARTSPEQGTSEERSA